VRKAERAWFLSEGEESEALGINGARPHFVQKMGPGTIYSLGQKQRVFLPCSLSLSSMVAASISQNLCPEHSNQLSRKWRCLRSILIFAIKNIFKIFIRMLNVEMALCFLYGFYLSELR
jgi:hypothetical protein